MSGVVIGLLTGALVGASSIGSGSLVTPLLLLFTTVPAGSAIGTSLALASGTKLVGYLAHRRMGHIDHRLGLWLILGAIPGTLVAGLGLAALRQFALPPSSMRHFVGLLLVVLALALFVVQYRCTRAGQSGADPLPRKTRVEPHHALIVGAAISLVVTLTSIGSGGLLMMALLLWRPVAPAGSRAPLCGLVGTAILYGLVATMLGAGAHLALSNIDGRLLLQLAAGTVPGVLLGAQMSRLIPERYYQTGVAGLNLVLGLRLALAG